MNLGENIYQQRNKHRLSQEALAQALEVSRQSVSKWENNSAVPELDKLVKMSELFEISLDELVKGEQPAAQPQSPYRSVRVQIGAVTMIFGMVFFLLSIFWGNHLYFGEAFGELMSVSIVLLAISLLATYNAHVLALCSVIYFLYCIVCFGILHVNTVVNYLFVFLSGLVILIWFLVWGTHESRFGGFKGNKFDPT